MTLDLSAILKVQGASTVSEGEFTYKPVIFMGDEVRFVSPFYVNTIVENIGGILKLNVSANVKIGVNCFRCTKPINVDCKFSFSENLKRDKSQVTDSEDSVSDEDVIIFSGYNIEIDDVVVNNFLMNFDYRYLCKEDCKGICLKCGADLNDGDCECEKGDIDPRMAVLSQLFKDKGNK